MSQVRKWESRKRDKAVLSEADLRYPSQMTRKVKNLERVIRASERAAVLAEAEAALSDKGGCDCDASLDDDGWDAPDHAVDCPVYGRWAEYRARIRNGGTQ